MSCQGPASIWDYVLCGRHRPGHAEGREDGAVGMSTGFNLMFKHEALTCS